MPKFETNYRCCEECQRRMHNLLYTDAASTVCTPCKEGDSTD